MTISMPSLIICGLLVLTAILALPIFPWSRKSGYANAGAIAAALAVISINALATQALP